MMGIYIPNMKMPDSCTCCPMAQDGLGSDWCYLTGNDIVCEGREGCRDVRCPLVEMEVDDA